jgi:hypothetical protein
MSFTTAFLTGLDVSVPHDVGDAAIFFDGHGGAPSLLFLTFLSLVIVTICNLFVTCDSNDLQFAGRLNRRAGRRNAHVSNSQSSFDHWPGACCSFDHQAPWNDLDAAH